MKTSRILAFGLASVLVVALPAVAQSTAGESELAFALSVTEYTESDFGGTVIANLRYGRFLSDALELGGEVYAGGELDDLDQFLTWGVFASYHFAPEETSTWYVRGGYGATVDEPGDGFIEGGGGIKVYFAPDVAFFWEAGYGTGISDDLDTGVIRSVAGLSFTL